MADEEITPTQQDTGDAFSGDAEPVSEAVQAAPESAPVSEPSGDDAFADANDEGSDEGNGTEQVVSQGAPEEYGDFVLPEGFNADADGMSTFQDEARERGLTQDQAQSELDLLLRWQKREEGRMSEQWQQQAGEWTQASKAAGLMTAESRSLASVGLKALDHDQSASRYLKNSGLDRHPAIVAAFKAYGASISDDSNIPGVNSNGGTVQKSAAEVLYPNQT
jgi:hypothetical protein